MGANTKIEWADHTWNPWMGCAKVSPACDNCYAEALMDGRLGRVDWGPGNDRRRTSAQNWNEPFKWDRAAKRSGTIASVFCLSLGDIWDNEVDSLWRRDAFSVMEKTPNLLYLLLSKRIGNADKMCDPLSGGACLPQNTALGATMVNQGEWDRDLFKLIDAGRILGARFTFASIEPMLGPINCHGVFPDWVICGGESGPNARPMHPSWVRSLRDQCQAAGVPFFFKQHGEWAPAEDWPSEIVEHYDVQGLTQDGVVRVGKKRAGRLLDGREWNEVPA